MFKQGRSLGRQLARQCKPALDTILESAKRRGANVWFLGRDCFALYSAYKKRHSNVRYLAGLNRACAKELDKRNTLHTYIRELGVCDGDVLVDSGFRGSIFDRIRHNDAGNGVYVTWYLLSADTACRYPSLHVKRSTVLALEHSPKPETVAWDEATQRPLVTKIPRTGARGYTDESNEVALGLDQVATFISGFVTGYNE